MARMRAKTSPKINNHSTGCTERVNMSVGSCRSLRTSHDAIIIVFLQKLRISQAGEIWRGCAIAMLLSKSPGCAAGSCSFTEISSRFQGIACVMDKHVAQCGMLAAYRGFEMIGCVQRDDTATMHDANTSAKAVGLLHRVSS